MWKAAFHSSPDLVWTLLKSQLSYAKFNCSKACSPQQYYLIQTLVKVCLLQQPYFYNMSHSSVIINLKPLEYLVFHIGSTLIELGLLWWSSPIQPLLVFHYWNLYLELYTETSKFLLFIVLIYKASRYIVFCQSDN